MSLTSRTIPQIRIKDRRPDGQRTDEKKQHFTVLSHLYHYITLTRQWSPFIPPHSSSPDRSSDTEPALSFRYQTNGFATLYKYAMALEPRSLEYCMMLVTRHLLVSRVESEANNDLRSSFLGSDSISGVYKWRGRKGVQVLART
ncbi:hypothetical protein SCLCIDRAFT_1223324 [Scleroderma citrinum Foug A]|uniref:Uncharacterized protein n=1 Tax=Scleroderma citrinum Foug A TaxID=1036808 RepID=A0A0C3D947_9AGAM|nr:hypothetical protein SCLCIDRAFT_1223324 [Scleroderma citrinum Foug A]